MVCACAFDVFCILQCTVVGVCLCVCFVLCHQLSGALDLVVSYSHIFMCK